jgi:hypothetical protein
LWEREREKMKDVAMKIIYIQQNFNLLTISNFVLFFLPPQNALSSHLEERKEGDGKVESHERARTISLNAV